MYVVSTQYRCAELKQVFCVPEPEWQGEVWVPRAGLF